MVEQSSALRILEEVLDTASQDGPSHISAGTVLLNTLKQTPKPQNMIAFYSLLARAVKEAELLVDKESPQQRRITRNIEQLHALNSFFLENHLWGMAWHSCRSHIEQRNFLTVLHSLAEEYFKQCAFVKVPQDTINSLIDELNSIVEKVLDTDLSKDLKQHLILTLNELISTLRNYQVEGTQGIYQKSGSLSYRLLEVDTKVKEADRNNSAYQSATSWVLSIATFFAPQSMYDVASFVPAMHDFYIPKLEQLMEKEKQIESLLKEKSSLYDVLKELNSEGKPVQTQAILEPQIPPKQPRLESAKSEEEE